MNTMCFFETQEQRLVRLDEHSLQTDSSWPVFLPNFWALTLFQVQLAVFRERRVGCLADVMLRGQ